MILCSGDSEDMAKLYGNKSAALYQLALQAENEEPDSELKVEILQHALDDGLKSVELDTSYEKGHFRLVLSRLLTVKSLVVFGLSYCCSCFSVIFYCHLISWTRFHTLS